MSTRATSRDRFRTGVAAVTGLVAAGAMASTGWAAGAAAQDARAARAARALARYHARLARIVRRQSAALRPAVVVQLGYDRDFRLLEQLGETHDGAGGPPSPDAWKRIGLGVDTLRVPDGTELDLGATGKAWSADLRVASPDGTPWVVDVSEHPGAPADTTVTLSHGGLATSTTQVRRWTRHGVRRHHLLDPRTGRPTSGPWRTATAVGETCVAANTATTAALVLGADAPAWLDGHAVTARLVARDGALAKESVA